MKKTFQTLISSFHGKPKKTASVPIDFIPGNKLKVMTVWSGSSHDLPADKFWEASNLISEGHYERWPMDSAYDQALNACVGKLYTQTKRITYFEPFKREKGYESFTVEGGDKIIRGKIEKVLKVCKENKTSAKKTILKSALHYEREGMQILALAEGKAGAWEFSGFAVLRSIPLGYTR